jgi:hypothetical protein
LPDEGRRDQHGPRREIAEGNGDPEGSRGQPPGILSRDLLYQGKCGLPSAERDEADQQEASKAPDELPAPPPQGHHAENSSGDYDPRRADLQHSKEEEGTSCDHDSTAAVPGPYVVCVGSDRSPSLGRLQSPAGVSEQQAVNAALARWRQLSAAILVSVESQAVVFTGIERSARARLYLNQRATHLLTSTEVETLKRVNFNRWRYSRPHDPWKVPRDESSSRRHSGGQLVYKPLQNGNVEIEIPSWLVLEALEGPTNIIEELDLRDDDYVRRVLTGGWEIVNVRMVPGDVTRAEPARVLLELRPVIQVFGDDHQPRKPGGSSRRR